MTGKTGSPGVPTIQPPLGAMKSSTTANVKIMLGATLPISYKFMICTSVGVLVSQHPPQKKKIHLYGILPFITGKFTCYSRRYQVSWSPPRHHQHLGQIVPFLVPQLCLFLSPLDTSSQWLGLREFYGFFIIKHGWILQTIINNMDLTWYQ